MKKISSTQGLEHHLEVSVKLALSLGWKFQQMRVADNELWLPATSNRMKFDYRDPLILWPLAVLYDAFPFESASPLKKEWITSSGKSARVNSSRGETPELATALAIIEAAKTFKPKR
jgi:hypothetical protein